jgi:hypothetical protein
LLSVLICLLCLSFWRRKAVLFILCGFTVLIPSVIWLLVDVFILRPEDGLDVASALFVQAAPYLALAWFFSFYPGTQRYYRMRQQESTASPRHGRDGNI